MNAGISLANAEYELQNYDRAKNLLDHICCIMDTLNYDKKHSSKLYLFEVYTKYYLGIGDFRNAFVYQEKAFSLSDSLIKKEKILHSLTSSQLAKSASKYFEHELQMERLAKEKETLQMRLLMWIIILVVFSAGLTLTILYYNYKQRIRLQAEKLKTREQEKQLLDLELEYKKKDLVDMALSLSQKQEWARELNLHIQNIELAKGHKRSREFRNLKDEIRNNVHVDKKLELLQQNINTLSKEFYDKLNRKFPGLTKTDIKLCSYIKLNLSNAHIAHLQNIDPGSVKVSRYRLKKKINLGPDQDLNAFLQAL